MPCVTTTIIRVIFHRYPPVQSSYTHRLSCNLHAGACHAKAFWTDCNADPPAAKAITEKTNKRSVPRPKQKVHGIARTVRRSCARRRRRFPSLRVLTQQQIKEELYFWPSSLYHLHHHRHRSLRHHHRHLRSRLHRHRHHLHLHRCRALRLSKIDGRKTTHDIFCEHVVLVLFQNDSRLIIIYDLFIGRPLPHSSPCCGSSRMCVGAITFSNISGLSGRAGKFAALSSGRFRLSLLLRLRHPLQIKINIAPYHPR